MKTVKVHLKSVSPYSQSRAIGVPKNASESGDDYERRTWRERIHADADGLAYIPPMAFKKAIDAAAKYSAVKIPGGRSATYTKHVESGIIIIDPMPLGVKKDQVEGEWLFLDANGKKGKQSSGRVLRQMPKFDHWEGELTIRVIDEVVLHTKAESKMTILEYILRQAGSLIGIGRFRAENGGFYGRFVVQSFEIMEDSDEAAA
jgi:hypothetical protein